MYQITYQKSNGEIFKRIRNTLPKTALGKETSMGWKLIDIKYAFGKNYYSLLEYNNLQRKQYKKIKFKLKFLKHLKQYSLVIIIIIIVPFII